MSLLAPWALWFALTGAAIVGLYLLKTRLRRQPVPDLELWLKLLGRTQVRSLFQRLRRWFSLLLWLVIAACLVLALGNPVFTAGSVKPQAIAVILDNSASMQTIEESDDGTRPTRLTLAPEALGELTTRRPVNDEWLLIEAGRRPRVLASWTRNARELREAAAALEPHLGSSDLAAAHELARQLLAGKERPAVVFLSDGADGKIEHIAVGDRSYGDETIVYWPIGSTRDNLGITRLAVRAHRQLATHHVQIGLHNAGASAVQTRLVLEVDGRTAAVEPLEVPPAGEWEKVVVLSFPLGGVLRVTHEHQDALAGDNEAYAILEPIRPARVLLVTDPHSAFFFEQALAAMEPLIDPEVSHTVGPAEYDRLDLANDQPDLTIFNQCVPRTLPARGAFVFVGVWPEETQARVIGELQRPLLSLVRRDHPLVRYLNFAGATVARAAEVDLTQRATVLATGMAGAPLIFLCRQPDRDMLCLAFDVLETDLPFRNAFPILLRNAVSYLVSEQRAWVQPDYAIGETIEPLRPLPANVSNVTVGRFADGSLQEESLSAIGGAFAYEKTDRPGPLRFAIGTDTAYTAVNLTEPGETRIAPVAARSDPAERLALSGRLFGLTPWIGLAALATLLIGLEWLTYHFRWTE